MISCVKVCTESLFNTFIFRLSTNVEKIPSDKINVTKNALFFLLRAPAHHILTFNSQFLFELKQFISLNQCKVISIFDSVSFLLKFIFSSAKNKDSLTVKPQIFYFNKNNRKATHSLLLDLWFVSCNKKFENSIIETNFRPYHQRLREYTFTWI